MSFIGATGLNTFDEEIENTSNYATRISLDSSNYILNTSNVISNLNFNSSNYTSNVNFNSSNYTSNVNFNSSNYTSRIEGELSDRIGYPFSIIPPRFTSGLYIPLKAQELQLTETNGVVATHTGAIGIIEGQIEAIVGVGGFVGGIYTLINGSALGGAINMANTANNKANLANDKVDNLITTTTTEKGNTSNYILNTSNVISTRINNLNSGSVPTIDNVFPLFYDNHFQQISDGLNPNQISVKNINLAGRFDYDYLKIPPMIPTDTIVPIQEPTSSPSVPKITINGEYKYMSFTYTTGATNTPYTITFNENTECDILIVGGGGAGGKTDAGGGGAGGLIYETGLFLNGTYNILVGKGGNINNTGGNVGLVGQNGTNSRISNTLSFNKEAIGGGGGGSGHPSDIESLTVGGSSGGLGTSDRIRNIGFTTGQGNQGGLGATANGAADAGAGDGGGGGGGGAGGSGFDSPSGTGGIGRQIIITGTNTYYAGGGGGGHGNNSLGGLGGGGEGRASGNGLNATFHGGGGGGGGGGWGAGGSGFAGIVIIRYKTTKIVVSQVQSTGFLNYNNVNGWIVSQVSGGGGTIPTTLSDLTGTMLKNRISDFPTIPTQLNQLGGQIPVSTISNFPFIPTQLNQLGGQIPVSSISGFPSIPDAYTKGQINQVLTAYQFGITIIGNQVLSTSKFRYSMNTFGNFDNGFNARMYISMSARGTDFQVKWCFATVYMKWNSGTNITVFQSHIINSNNNNEWTIDTGGSSDGNFWANIDVIGGGGSGNGINEIYFRTS